MTLAELLATNGDWPGSLTDQQALDWLNTSIDVNRDSVSGDEMFQATDSTDWLALSDAEKSQWLAMCARDTLDPFGSANVALVTALFGGGSDTVAALIALRKESVQRWALQSDHSADMGDESKLYHIARVRP